ncbi:MAG TPA: ABC transporter substrate-binding protein, partial [Thermomicrobiales bacterium]|nr:ABC transporter substrate-binding protein [Thermomicrobiales bacterium]
MSAKNRLTRHTAVSGSWLLLAVLLLLVPLLAACGGDDDDATPIPTATKPAGSASPTGAASTSEPAGDGASPTPGASGEPAATTEPGDTLMGVEIEPAAHEGGTFIEGSSADLQTVNPIIANDSPTLNFLALIYEPLVELHPETLEPVGVLADSWEVSSDGLTWTFRLRDGVTWQDGEPFTAKDVKFTYELHMNEASNSSYGGDLLAKIGAIEVVDPLTVAFTLPQPYADFAVDVATYGII